MTKYSYEGPVVIFERVVEKHWKGETVAVTEAKAKSNLSYQWKRQHGYFATAAPIKFPNKLKVVWESE